MAKKKSSITYKEAVRNQTLQSCIDKKKKKPILLFLFLCMVISNLVVADEFTGFKTDKVKIKVVANSTHLLITHEGNVVVNNTNPQIDSNYEFEKNFTYKYSLGNVVVNLTNQNNVTLQSNPTFSPVFQPNITIPPCPNISCPDNNVSVVCPEFTLDDYEDYINYAWMSLVAIAVLLAGLLGLIYWQSRNKEGGGGGASVGKSYKPAPRAPMAEPPDVLPDLKGARF